MVTGIAPLFINLCAGDRWFEGWEGSDIAPRDPRLKAIDATSLPYADGSVDVAMMSHGLTALQEIEDGWARCFAEVYRVLRPHGAFRIDDAPARWFDSEGARDPRFQRAHPRSDLVDLLVTSGFVVFGGLSDQTCIPTGPAFGRDYTPNQNRQLFHGLLNNKSWHESFTLECFKAP